MNALVAIPSPGQLVSVRNRRFVVTGIGAGVLGYGFHDTPLGVRFTIGEPARREVLARLLELNYQRHAEEVAADTAGPTPGHQVGRVEWCTNRGGPGRVVQSGPVSTLWRPFGA